MKKNRKTAHELKPRSFFVKAFTLLEIIIAISILAIIVVTGVVSYASFNSQAFDARRKQDLVTLRSALEVYKSTTGCYPSDLDLLVSGGYLNKELRDPKTNDPYTYTRSGPCPSGYADYTVQASLEGGVPLAMNPFGAVPTPTTPPPPPPTPTPQPPTATPTPPPAPLVITAKVFCSGPKTPDQLCKDAGRLGAQSGANIAKGYLWKQCAGASISSCSGIECTVNMLDCTNDVDAWGCQKPQYNSSAGTCSGAQYPTSYYKYGSALTVYTANLDANGTAMSSCTGYNPGWTVRVNCL